MVWKGVKRYRPQWRKTGNKRWQNFPNVGSFGERKLAEKFIKETREKFRKVGRMGRFRIKVDYERI